MIVIKQDNVSDVDFVNLLKNTKSILLPFLKVEKGVSYTSFETLVYEYMVKASHGTDFEGTVEQTGVHAFPDIIAKKYFGVEVKHTSQNHWSSTGNSILETSRIDDVQRIYMFFGKFGGEIDIKYRLYQECLHEVSVTHSPRYRINMDLDRGKSIFDKIGVEYDTLRKQSNSIQTIKNYYRSQLKDGEELWWIDQDSDEKAVSPIIKPLRHLSSEQKESFIADCFILFPEMFGKSNTKFERAAAYLIAEYNAVSANLRDSFTAGGQEQVIINAKTINVPKIYFKLKNNADNIVRRINEIDESVLEYYWRKEAVSVNRLEQWKALIDEHAISDPKSVKPSEAFALSYGS